jgi:hypothetical protein
MSVTASRPVQAVTGRETVTETGWLLALAKFTIDANAEVAATPEYQRILTAIETAGICAQCGGVIAENEDIYVVQVAIPMRSMFGDAVTERAPVCARCAEAHTFGHAMYCPACQRVVHYEHDHDQTGACSGPCRRAIDAKRKRLNRARERQCRLSHICETCAAKFTPTRSDARYCSNACRQDAYRKRKLSAR